MSDMLQYVMGLGRVCEPYFLTRRDVPDEENSDKVSKKKNEDEISEMKYVSWWMKKC